jgi:hypothetical protein
MTGLLARRVTPVAHPSLIGMSMPPHGDHGIDTHDTNGPQR